MPTTRILRRLFLVLLGALILAILPVGIWLTVRSSDYLRVQGYTYDQATGDVVMERTLLQGDAIVRSYISVIGSDGRSCFYHSERIFEANDAQGLPITKETFSVAPDLKPCLASRPYSVVGRYFVKAFGGLLLKPVFYFEPPRGEDGRAPGRQGEQGEKGDTGDTGPTGPTGPQGKPG
jgi:hypothetical protein